MSVQVIAVASGAAIERGAATDTLDSSYIQTAIEAARAKIGVIPGSGIVRGGWRYNGKAYAFRDNALGTFCGMYEATTAGWVAVDLGKIIHFDAGTDELVEGLSLTGGTSGATATIERVIVQTGGWATNDAVGYVVLSDGSGLFLDNETITDSGTGSATSNGQSSVIRLQAGGHFEFMNKNFGGSTGTKRMYGVDGVSNGFEFDGTVFVPIITGMTIDAPTHLAEHKKHLFFSFPLGSVQHSGIGEPYLWTLITGAGELGMGDDVTGFLSGIGGALAIYAQDKLAILYGTSSADWNLVTISDESGAFEWTIQDATKAVHLDANGLADLHTVQSYGDFKAGRLSFDFDPYLKHERKEGALPISSVRLKSKNQYRLFYDDNDALAIDLSGKKPAAMVIDYGMPVRYAGASDDSDGEEWVFFGSDDGYLYRMDVGTSFDGVAVDAYFRLPFIHQGTPSRNKRYHKATLEVDAGPTLTLNVAAEFSYASSNAMPLIEQALAVKGGGGFWDEATWDDFYWDSQVEGVAEAHIDGQGTNISLSVASSSIYDEPHTIHGVTLHYSDRGLAR